MRHVEPDVIHLDALMSNKWAWYIEWSDSRSDDRSDIDGTSESLEAAWADIQKAIKNAQ